MSEESTTERHDFKGLGYSKIGHFKQVRAKIRELEDISNEREAIINNMTDGLTILDQDLNILFANRIQQDLFQDRTLIGKKCFTAFYQKSSCCSGCPALITLGTEKTLSGEIIINRKTPARRFVEWSTFHIKDPSGCAPKIILLMRDITKRKENEFEFMRADRLAAMGLLVSGIAHEINNPLTSIAGFSESLLKRLKTNPEYRDSQLSKEFQDYLEIINQEAYRCSNIIHNLIRYTRESTDDFLLVDISQILHDTILLIKPYAKDLGIRFNFQNGSKTEPLNLVGNESHLKHLFLNLLNYALESMVDGGSLTVQTQTDSKDLEILITNIDSESLPYDIVGGTNTNAPKPFHTAQIDTGGTPLSLSVCSNIVQNHRGELNIKHNNGGGFVIFLKLPTVDS